MFKRKIDKWYETARKLYRKDKLEEPYNSLFDYYRNMTMDTPYRDCAYLNHFSYFFHYKEEGQLQNLSTNLNRILPEELRDNFNNALEKFSRIVDYDAEENGDLFEDENLFVEDNSEVLKAILEKYINSIEN